MRHPRQLWHDMGPTAFFTFNIMVGGNVLSALAYPIMIWIVLSHLFAGILTSPPPPLTLAWPMPLHLATLVTGLFSAIVIGAIGLARRGRVQDSWILWLTVFYWACLSIAAWRALGQYVWNPYHWEKTAHGLAQRPNRISSTVEDQAERYDRNPRRHRTQR